jgi:hypothetical protein
MPRAVPDGAVTIVGPHATCLAPCDMSDVVQMDALPLVVTYEARDA